MKQKELPNYTNEEMSALIDSVIHDKRARLVLKLRLCDHLTYAEIAEYPEVNRCERQIGYILNRYLPVIAENM
jgi:hypothetical protein